LEVSRVFERGAATLPDDVAVVLRVPEGASDEPWRGAVCAVSNWAARAIKKVMRSLRMAKTIRFDYL
jgi:hypothetical protein